MQPVSSLHVEVRKSVSEVVLVLGFVVSRHVEKLEFGSKYREPSRSRHCDLGEWPTNCSIPAEHPLVVLDVLQEQVELVSAEARLGLKRRTRDVLATPRSPTTSGRVDAEHVPVQRQLAMYGGLVVTLYGDLHVVVVPSDSS